MASNSSSKPAIPGISYSCPIIHQIASVWGFNPTEWFPKDAVPSHGNVEKLPTDVKQALAELAEATGAQDRAIAIDLIAQALKERKEASGSWNRFASVDDIQAALARYVTIHPTTTGVKPTFTATVTVQSKSRDLSPHHGVRRARSKSNHVADDRAPQRRRLEQPTATADTVESLTSDIRNLKLKISELENDGATVNLQAATISNQADTIKRQDKTITDQADKIKKLQRIIANHKGTIADLDEEVSDLQTEKGQVGELAITFCKAWLAVLINNKHSSSSSAASTDISNHVHPSIAATDIDKAMRVSLGELQHKLSLDDVIPKAGAARASIDRLVDTLDRLNAYGLWYQQLYNEKDQVNFEAAPEDVEEDEREVEGYGADPDDDNDGEMDMDDGGVGVGYFPFDLFKDDLEEEEEDMEEMEE